jgi:hypothetical protein
MQVFGEMAWGCDSDNLRIYKTFIMKIISRDDREIVIQREEFIVNLSATQIILTMGLVIFFVWIVLHGSDGSILEEFPSLLLFDDLTNPLFIGIVFGAIVYLGEYCHQIWNAIKSPARTRSWDRCTFDKEQNDVNELTYKWSSPSSIGALSEIKNIEIVVDINYNSEANDPENVDMYPTSLYHVVMTFEDDRQVLLERNDIQLASPDKVQQLFRQTLTETNQVVLELRTFLGLCSSIDE